MTDDTRLRRIWAALPEGGAHVDEATWERFAVGELDRAERDRLVEHVVACASCTRVYRAVTELATEARSIDPSLPSWSPAVAAESAPRRRTWWAVGAGAAAVATLVVALALRPEPGPERLRGTATPVIELVAAPSATRVAWRPVTGAESYRVRIFTDDGRVAHTLTVPATEASWPEGAPGKYHLTIEALRGGEVLARSRLATFTMAR